MLILMVVFLVNFEFILFLKLDIVLKIVDIKLKLVVIICSFYL